MSGTNEALRETIRDALSRSQSQEGLAKALGVSPRDVEAIRRGERVPVDQKRAADLEASLVRERRR